MSSSRKAPYVAMETDVHKDERFGALTDIAGLANRYEAIGRMHALWSWCTDRGLLDAPEDCDGYAVHDAVVRRFLGPKGVEAILAEGCDELALGVRRPDGLIYLRGTSETVRHRRRLARTAQAGGEARSRAPRHQGRFVPYDTNLQPFGWSVAGDEPPIGHPGGWSDSQDGEIAKSKLPASESVAANTNHQPSGWLMAGESPAIAPAGTSVQPTTNNQREEEEDLSGKPDAPARDLFGEVVAKTATATGDLGRNRAVPVLTAKERRDADARELAKVAIGEINRLAGTRFDPEAESSLKFARALIRDKRTADDVLLVVRSKRAWIGDPKMGAYFRPSTLLGAENFTTYLDEAKAEHGQPGQLQQPRSSGQRPGIRNIPALAPMRSGNS